MIDGRGFGEEDNENLWKHIFSLTPEIVGYSVRYVLFTSIEYKAKLRHKPDFSVKIANVRMIELFVLNTK